jgi:hypothetical protein
MSRAPVRENNAVIAKLAATYVFLSILESLGLRGLQENREAI